MLSWTATTALVFVILVATAIAYDIIAYARGGNAATFSYICLSVANRYRGFAILLAFAIGVLFGHLFLPQHVAP
jgi:hypothetical protein